MTRRIDEFDQPLSGDHYAVRHRDWPKSLAEQDTEWARSERLQQQRDERKQRRQG